MFLQRVNTCIMFSFLFIELLATSALGQYTPDWASLDSRPLPQWYDDSKIGIFLHWGLYSVPSFGSAWFWNKWQGEDPSYVEFMSDNFRPGFTYQDFGPDFTAEFYEPDEWAELFEAAGARYVVLTSKHHEGYTMWPSKYSWGWNVMDVGPKRDLLGDLANSIRKKTNLRFGIYHSLYEWFNPLYLEDKANEFQTNEFVVTKSLPALQEVIELYKPEVIWSDGDWEAHDWYWNSTLFLAWLFNDSPVKNTVVTNDRWGKGISCNHGSFYTCSDRYNPGVLQTHKWENCMTLDRNYWGYNRKSTYADFLSIKELLRTMIKTVSCGGNLLVNTGPTHDGRIAPIMEERLRQMGSWLSTNGEAIYGSRPWLFQNDSLTPGVWYTQKNSLVYATVLSWPLNDVLVLGSVKTGVVKGEVTVHVIGYPVSLGIRLMASGLEVIFPPISYITGEWAWVLKIAGLIIVPSEEQLTPQNIEMLQESNKINV